MRRFTGGMLNLFAALVQKLLNDKVGGIEQRGRDHSSSSS